MRVLVACEYSGRVRNAFRALGHDGRSCDLLEAEDAPTAWHWQDSLEHVIARDQNWDLLIAHPPCTYLCNSGVRWLHERPDRWQLMREGAEFFRWILGLPIPRIAVENPVMHKYAREIVGSGHDFSVQPWQFGDPAKKRTCFWTRGLPPLTPTSDMTAADARADCHLASPGPERWKKRSRTHPGLAQAIADQWGAVLNERAA
jgi:hypothetical protein